MDIPPIFPDKLTIGNFQISETLLTAFVVTIIITIFALAFRFAILRNFTKVPRGIQNVLELMIESVSRFTGGIMGERGKSMAPYILTIFAFIIVGGLTEYLGFRPPATDLNCTIALALISFILIIAYSIRYTGVVGWLKSYTKPKAFITPFNVISSIALPISLACRLFGNLFSGLVIMHMIYGAMGYFAIGIPAFASIYLVLFHIVMQSYVFSMLTLSFTEERLAEE